MIFLQLIESSEASSLKSWDSVLKYDELVEMMQIGEVFYGFREMMPRFPPTYKRKLHDSGDCGDYSRYEDLVKGYSHTGEDKEVITYMLSLVKFLSLNNDSDDCYGSGGE